MLLDALGKFSLVYVYVLVIFVVAFRLHLPVSDNFTIDVYVIPASGFFFFLIATCISLVLGNVLLFYHRRVMYDSDTNTVVRPVKVSILNQGFFLLSGRKRLSSFSQVFLLVLISTTLGMILYGFFQESFVFKIGGIAGDVIDDDAALKKYSVFTLGLELTSSAQSNEVARLVLLQGIYFFVTVLTPILSLTFTLILLYVPMEINSQKSALIVAEITRSWTATEVFIFSIFAALFQISAFAPFVVGDRCYHINALAEEMFKDKEEDVTCFNVDAYVDSSCWFLFVGVVLNSFIVSSCLSLAEHTINQRQQHTLNHSIIAEDFWEKFTMKLCNLPFMGKLFDILPEDILSEEFSVQPINKNAYTLE